MIHDHSVQMTDLPGSELDVSKIPGHIFHFPVAAG
jgi:hypothetical protein